MKKSRKNDLKILEGDFKKDRPKKNIPRMPRGLSPDNKSWWKKIIKSIDSSILLPSDRIALMLLCQSLASYEKIKVKIEQEGETYQSMNEEGIVVILMRPEVEILSLYYDNVMTGLREFLCIPCSRRELGDKLSDITDNKNEDF